MAGQVRASRERASRTAVHLTPTETAVLTLLPTHRTLAAIGDRLGISRPTVKTHVQHIYKKLGATNRAEAVESAESAGLLPTGRERLVGRRRVGPRGLSMVSAPERGGADSEGVGRVSHDRCCMARDRAVKRPSRRPPQA